MSGASQVSLQYWRWFPVLPRIFGISAIFCVLLVSRSFRVPDRGGALITVPLPPPTLTLAPPNLLRPITPQEAVKENSERAFSARPDSPPRPFRLSGDPASQARALNCLTQAVYYEAASEGIAGERAVAQVVLNRVRHPGFPASICGVIYQGSEGPTGCQFSFTCDGSMTRAPLPALWKQAQELARQALEGVVFAPVGHATHYHADYVLPYWADSLDKSVEIGHHIFYRLKGALGNAPAFTQKYAGQENESLPPGHAAVVLQAQNESDPTGNPDPDQHPTSADSSIAPSEKPAELMADTNRGVLLAEDSNVPSTRPAHAVSSKSEKCPVATTVKLKPLSPTNVRTSDLEGCAR